MSRLRQLVVAASLAALSHAASAAFGGLFVFGDSLSDSGNDALAIGVDAAQVITGNTYIPNKPYASGQFSNGNVWVLYPMAPAPGQRWVPLAWIALGLIGTAVQLGVTANRRS